MDSLLGAEGADMASGGVIALQPGSKTEKEGGVDDGNVQDFNEGFNKLRKGGRVLVTVGGRGSLNWESISSELGGLR